MKKRTCPKCHAELGMALEPFYTEDGKWFGWHCAICGEILDKVIAFHRKLSLNRKQRVEMNRKIHSIVEWAIH